MNRTFAMGVIVFGLLISSSSQAGLGDKLKALFDKDEKSTEQASEGLSSEDRIAGLKEALGQGVAVAIETLGKTDGFWADELVQISMPDELQSLAKTASKLGGKRYVNEFHETLNRAAEQAIPVAADIFSKAINDMTVDDALGIIRGPEDAATQYFRAQTEDSLKEQFQPIVTTATDEAGVTQAYKKLQSRAGGLMSVFGSDEDLNLDTYVTESALEGLFFYVASEEKKIRENPVARTTDLLKALFGSD